MNELIKINNGVATTTSLKIADVFEKEHRHVLRDIKNIANKDKYFNGSNFGLVEYCDKKGEARPMYNITRDGFTILVMGFIGEKAFEWKKKYIEAFNKMEAKLKGDNLIPDDENGRLQLISDLANKIIGKNKDIKLLEHSNNEKNKIIDMIRDLRTDISNLAIYTVDGFENQDAIDKTQDKLNSIQDKVFGL